MNNKEQSVLNIKQVAALLVQNDPQLLQKEKNIQRCKQILSQKQKQIPIDGNGSPLIDVVVFPQMAFTGYNFKNYEHVLPMAVFSNQGHDFQFAREVALRFNSYVVFGYVQKVLKTIQKQNKQQAEGQTEQSSQQSNSHNQTDKPDNKYFLYNSAAVLNRKGNLVLNTRKSHLYFCDELWCQEGDGFKSFQLINLKSQEIRCTVAICMDINQKHFSSGKQQLADYIISSQSQCLIFISNWTDRSPTTNQRNELIHILNYWLNRLEPLLQEDQPQRLFFISDRIGSEHNYYEGKQGWFLGCSGGLTVNPPRLYEVLDKKVQGGIFIRGRLQK